MSHQTQKNVLMVNRGITEDDLVIDVNRDHQDHQDYQDYQDHQDHRVHQGEWEKQVCRVQWDDQVHRVLRVHQEHSNISMLRCWYP